MDVIRKLSKHYQDMDLFIRKFPIKFHCEIIIMSTANGIDGTARSCNN
jgi:hypothetical protein